MDAHLFSKPDLVEVHILNGLSHLVVVQIMEVLQALVLKANLDLGNAKPDPTLQKIKGVAEDCLKKAHGMGIIK
jgi:hypothetical protein